MQAAGFIGAHQLGERAAAHVLAVTNAAALDAAIGCWDAKFTFVFARPSQVDNSIVVLPSIPGFLYGLPNHPSYPSGHSCVSAAAVTVLGAFFPERIPELQAGLVEAGLSREYGGIHYPFDVAAGQALGRSVGRLALDYDRVNGALSAVGMH
jgi:membrane-associated phospholipid phosphatase